MRIPLFQIDYLHYHVEDWQEKKAKLKQWLDKRTLVRRDSQDGLVSFWTDRFSENSSKEEFCQIFNKEIQQVGLDLGLNEMTIEDIWSVKYEKGDHHAPHDHGSCNYSLVLYVDYDENEHTSTQFLCPFKDATTNLTWTASRNTKEGDMIIFPSNILHLTLPNKSDKIRTIVSIDISTIGIKPAYTEH